MWNFDSCNQYNTHTTHTHGNGEWKRAKKRQIGLRKHTRLPTKYQTIIIKKNEIESVWPSIGVVQTVVIQAKSTRNWEFLHFSVLRYHFNWFSFGATVDLIKPCFQMYQVQSMFDIQNVQQLLWKYMNDCDFHKIYNSSSDGNGDSNGD